MATYSGWGFDVPMTAGQDLTSAQYRFVSASGTAGTVTLAKLAACTIGVLQNDPASGEEAIVRVFGTSKVYGVGAIAYGGLVDSTATGEAAAAGLAVSTYAAGICLETLASGCAMVEILLTPYGLRA